MAHLLGFGSGHDSFDSPHLGPLLENFEVMELRKQVSWSRTQPQLFHFRTQTGREVDIILEDAQGRLVAIEIKASATVGAHDFKSLKFLAGEMRKRFHRGLVLYTGTEPIPFGPRLQALPVDALWRLCGPSQKQKLEKKK